MFLLDTNLVIPWLRSAPSPVTAVVDALVERSFVAVSQVTVFELERKQRKLELEGAGRIEGAGRKQRVRLTKLLLSVPSLPLTDHGYEIAAEWWARAQTHKPAITITDADLFIASTAAAHGYCLYTAEARLAKNLKLLNFPIDVVPVGTEGQGLFPRGD